MWFWLVAQGMQSIEILSRASAFLVRKRTAKVSATRSIRSRTTC
jgi:hypothetical protein